MPTRVIVDGSNLATEGRTEPSLAQLDEAVREFQKEHPQAEITVVVDSTFGHRINESERRAFEEAELAGEIVSPPAGAIGRGDAFVLRIADKVGATVLSNDSFQEFHGEHDWLFDKGRLIGGKPVPGIGWIFTPRSPVRGPRSRQAVRAAKMGAPPVPDKPPPRAPRKAAAERAKRAPKPKVVEQAIKVAVDEAVEPSSARRRRRRTAAPPAEPVNEPLTFVTFIAEHHPGTVVRGEVESFSSHGAFIRVGMARCYLALADMGDPPPAAARQVLNRGEQRRFLVKAFDPPRRGIELSLMGVPDEGDEPVAPVKKATRKRAAAPKKAAVAKKVAAKRATPKKAVAKKAAPAKKKAAPAKKKTTPAKKTATKKVPAKKAAKKATKTTKKAAKKAR